MTTESHISALERRHRELDQQIDEDCGRVENVRRLVEKAEKEGLLPVVRYSVGRRLESTEPDYWDFATLLELAVLADDEGEAAGWLGKALAAVRETWEPASTANNLKLIREARRGRGVEQPWLDEMIGELEEAAG